MGAQQSVTGELTELVSASLETTNHSAEIAWLMPRSLDRCLRDMSELVGVVWDA